MKLLTVVLLFFIVVSVVQAKLHMSQADIDNLDAEVKSGCDETCGHYDQETAKNAFDLCWEACLDLYAR